MKQYAAYYLGAFTAIVVLTPMALDAAPRDQPEGRPRLTIRIYDYSGVPAKTLARAFHEAENIYRKAGISTVLIRCRIAVTDPVLDPRCGEITGPSVIRIRILNNRMAARTYADSRIFGFAVTAPQPDFGVVANVFHGRVERLMADTGANAGVVLGHVIAHEAGHLLLGMQSHTRRGIMHIPWDEPEISAAHRGALIFSRGQASKLRRAVAARILAGRPNRQSPAVLARSQPEAAAPTGL